MGASLGPVLANIIMTECEKKVADKLIRNGTLKFYVRYVDDTLMLIKRTDIEKVQKAFNKFDSNLKFTVDTFENETPHFLDLEISPNGLSIFRKNTFTGQYVNMDSFTTWRWKTAWLRSLIDRAKKICVKGQLHKELTKIKCFASWNGYPKHIVNSMIKRILSKDVSKPNTEKKKDENTPKIYFNLHYAGDQGEQLLKKCFKKLQRSLNREAIFVPKYTVTKLSFFTNMKDKLPKLSKSNVIYNFACPGCQSSYIGITNRTLFIRTKEHASREESAISVHLNDCSGVKHIYDMFNFFGNDVDVDDFKLNIVHYNT